MTEYMELLAAIEAIAAGDMTREAMVELATACLSGAPDVDKLFEEATAAQVAFWDKLRELEEAMGDGTEIDGSLDLRETTVEGLREARA
jgi:hypothetical protein